MERVPLDFYMDLNDCSLSLAYCYCLIFLNK